MDHAFIGCTKGAPEAEQLLRSGFVEGPANTHPGQGTANRRFFFENFMLELLWVSDPVEAQSDRTRPTRLWERCEQRDGAVSPFGVIFRPAGATPAAAPFATWDYAPVYLPPGVTMQVAAGTSLQEPELFYLPFLQRAARGGYVPHARSVRKILGLAVGVRSRDALSPAARSAEQFGLLRYFESPRPLLEIRFDGASCLSLDLQPDLPLIFRGAAG